MIISRRFAFFAAGRRPEAARISLPLRIATSERSARLSSLLTPERIDSYPAFNSADQSGFQDIEKELAAPGATPGRYGLNPLLKFPLVRLRTDLLIAPYPDALVWRMNNGPYYELREAHQRGSPGENPFSRFFGFVFQEYVGLLLENEFDSQHLLPEMAYGKSKRMGPDWIVTIGNTGIAIECTASSLPLAVKMAPDTETVRGEIRAKYVDKIRRLPGKIGALQRAGSPYSARLRHISQWHCVLVYREPLHPVEVFRRHFFDAETDMPDPYHIMDIEDFESLLSLNDGYGIERVLSEKETTSDRMREDFRTFLASVSRSTGRPLTTRTLRQREKEFFDDLLGELADG